MEKAGFYKLMAVLFILGILFTPQGSKTWIYFLIPGLVFGALWFWKLD